MTSSKGFLQIRNSDFMVVDPILQKRKLGLKERHTTNVWQSQTWNPGLLTLSSLVFPPHHAVQLRSLSKQGPNQTPTLCRTFWLFFLTDMGENTTYLPSKPFPLFLLSFFFLSYFQLHPSLYQSLRPILYTIESRASYLHTMARPAMVTHSYPLFTSESFFKAQLGPPSSQTRLGDLIQATRVPLSAPFVSCPTTHMALMGPCIFTPQLQVHELLGPHLL